MLRWMLLFLTLATAGLAQERRPSHCIALVENTSPPETLLRASFRDPVAPDNVRITYLDHSMFLIQGPEGTSVVTDYAGYLGTVAFVPTAVTMNNAHSSHFTLYPQEGIRHVLEGWGTADFPQDHHLDLGDMLIRNVHTDTRDGAGGRRENGNSIFIFEVAGLCIGHLGHLHQEPTPDQYAAIGRLDVVMAAVDGGLTLDHATMVKVMQRFRARVVLPMHWFGRSTLDTFLSGMTPDFAVKREGANSITLSLRTLPRDPTVVVLEPRFLSE
ncbi:MBL fold metallo-hydrolase [Aliiroseovarius sp.]|uniref:MBL fold metallo-hydrolase n=1 Tax=Aliiroseovarius sp. TaxID=1872442 RepID=UPI00262DB358|nr:MBL fold metallo-hydrolase [Aliiroseovarius sp.]